MLPSFLNLPPEIRNEIYHHLLVLDGPLNPGCICNGLQPSILFTNKTILHEARSILYGRNCFELEVRSELVSKFLETAGSVNTSCIESVRIEFPQLWDYEDEDPTKISLGDDSGRVLEAIRSHCPNLKKLILAGESTHGKEHELHEICLFQSDEKCDQVLAFVDSRFRAISSVQRIVVEVYPVIPSEYVRMKMESHGWILDLVEEPIYIDPCKVCWGPAFRARCDYHTFRIFHGDDSEYEDPSSASDSEV